MTPRCLFRFAALAAILACSAPAACNFSLAADARAAEAPSADDLRNVIERFAADRRDLLSQYDVPNSPNAAQRLTQFYDQSRQQLAELDFESLPQPAKIDYLLLDNFIRHAQRQLELDAAKQAKLEPLAPFLAEIAAFETARRRFEFIDAQAAAEQLVALAQQVTDARKAVAEALKGDAADDGGGRTVAPADDDADDSSDASDASDHKHADAMRGPFQRTDGRQAAIALREASSTLRRWYEFYAGYDPLATWWIAAPYEQLRQQLDDYADYLRREVAGLGDNDDDTILGSPIGKAALESELVSEMIPYSPERLIELAEREFAWCEAEMIKASRELGYGDDWKRALEHVKRQYVQPGEQPRLVRELHDEAVQFLEVRDLVTIPPLAKEVWGMTMMTPERQRVNPFFTGGETISVSFPTAGMSHEDKLMSMRGNNRHFARATVFHELIPGHRLQAYMQARYRTHRRIFSTPFWIEGWALYWEMQMWDLDFPRSPEDRIGMLFWRSHRCARIVFSLRFHLGEMTAAECVDYLVDRVGHERQNAAGEVRRSFETDYGPLYQAGYMLGGLQLRALRRELVEAGEMTPREFHDAVLKENSIPIAMVRASLTNQELTRDFQSNWRFDDY